jgi:formylglycine-generating enzyme required for sulfatase activity
MTRAAIVATILIVVSVFFFWPQILGKVRFGSVEPEVRTAVFERALTGRYGVAAILESGATALLKRSDVASIGDSRCAREAKCYGGRRSCMSVYVTFECGFDIALRQGGSATAVLRMSATQGAMPNLSSVTPDDFETLEPNIESALGFVCNDDLDCYKRRKPPLGMQDDARVFTECREGFCAPPMVKIPAGQFTRGTSTEEMERLQTDHRGTWPDDETPASNVTIATAFAVGRFEVTVADWNACAAELQCATKQHPQARSNEPAIDVSWQDITQDYLPWLNRKLGLSGATAYRLPSETEWEYAARGAASTRFASGDILDSHAAHVFTSPQGVSVVGQYAPNGFSLHDMAGNVRELVQDCRASDNATAPVDGRAYESDVCQDRMVRGGSWQELPVYARPAYRSFVPATERQNYTGFRLARSLPL